MEADLSSNKKQEEPEPNVEFPEIIPLQLGALLRLRSLEDPTLKAQTPVVGVVQKLVIMVEEPVFSSKEERITGRVGGDILCSYLLDGCLYKFKSRFGQILIETIVCIDYPKHIEARNLRAHPRIKVNLEAVSVIGREGKLINGSITDISKGGCCLELPGLIPLKLGIPVSTTFELPNDEPIDNLGCTIMNLRHIATEKITVIGLSFTGPGPEISKVTRFCEMCMYFRV